MNAAEMLKRLGHWVWTIARFIVFGCAGFCIIFYGTVMFMERVFFGNVQNSMSPFVALLLILTGAFMMLYGTSEWRRLAYLWVFLSIPISLFASLLLPESIGYKGVPAIAIGVAAFSTNALVRAYYKRKAQEGKHKV